MPYPKPTDQDLEAAAQWREERERYLANLDLPKYDPEKMKPTSKAGSFLVGLFEGAPWIICGAILWGVITGDAVGFLLFAVALYCIGWLVDH